MFADETSTLKWFGLNLTQLKGERFLYKTSDVRYFQRRTLDSLY